MVTKTGAITHIVHFMQREDVDINAEELFPSQSSAEVSALSVVRKVYQLRKDEVITIFRKHFDVGMDFKVAFYDRNRMKKGGILSADRDEMVPFMQHIEMQNEVVEEEENVLQE